MTVTTSQGSNPGLGDDSMRGYGRTLLLFLSFLLLVVEALWLARTLQYELSKPTVHVQAMKALLDHVAGDRQRGRGEHYAIWPENGFTFTLRDLNVFNQLEGYFAENVGEYVGLSPEDQYEVLEALDVLDDDIRRRIGSGNFFYPEGLSDEDRGLIISNAPLARDYIGFVRTRWGEQEYTLFFTLVSTPHDQELFRCYFASVSSAMEKLSLVRAMFGPSLVFLLTAFCLAGFGILRAVQVRKMQELNENLEEINKTFERFVPKDFLLHLNKGSLKEVALGEYRELHMSILFSDIRSFTTLSESMSPHDNFHFINSYLSEMGPVIRRHGGFIDKYIGDGIMALFHASADQALSAGIEMLCALKPYNEGRRLAGYPPIGIGVGINTGQLVIGTIGESERMDTTVISDSVNLAARIESQTRIFDVDLLITEQTFQSLEKPEDFCIRFIGSTPIKGKSCEAKIYEVFDADDQELRQGKSASMKLFLQALRLYQYHLYPQALVGFERCLKSCPGDLVAQYYSCQCRQHIKAKESASIRP